MDVDILSCATTGVSIAIPINNDAAAAILAKIANALYLFMHGIIVFILLILELVYVTRSETISQKMRLIGQGSREREDVFLR